MVSSSIIVSSKLFNIVSGKSVWGVLACPAYTQWTVKMYLYCFPVQDFGPLYVRLTRVLYALGHGKYSVSSMYIQSEVWSNSPVVSTASKSRLSEYGGENIPSELPQAHQHVSRKPFEFFLLIVAQKRLLSIRVAFNCWREEHSATRLPNLQIPIRRK